MTGPTAGWLFVAAACLSALSCLSDVAAAATAAKTASPPPGVGDVSEYSVRWTTLNPEPGLSKDGQATYANSMPIGNGHVAANVN